MGMDQDIPPLPAPSLRFTDKLEVLITNNCSQNELHARVGMRPSKLGITRTGNAPHWNEHCLDGDMFGAVDSSVEAFFIARRANSTDVTQHRTAQGLL